MHDRGGGIEPDFPDFLDFQEFLEFFPSLLILIPSIYKECAREYMNKTILASEKTKPIFSLLEQHRVERLMLGRVEFIRKKD